MDFSCDVARSAHTPLDQRAHTPPVEQPQSQQTMHERRIGLQARHEGTRRMHRLIKPATVLTQDTLRSQHNQRLRKPATKVARRTLNERRRMVYVSRSAMTPKPYDMHKCDSCIHTHT